MQVNHNEQRLNVNPTPTSQESKILKSKYSNDGKKSVASLISDHNMQYDKFKSPDKVLKNSAHTKHALLSKSAKKEISSQEVL